MSSNKSLWSLVNSFIQWALHKHDQKIFYLVVQMWHTALPASVSLSLLSLAMFLQLQEGNIGNLIRSVWWVASASSRRTKFGRWSVSHKRVVKKLVHPHDGLFLSSIWKLQSSLCPCNTFLHCYFTQLLFHLCYNLPRWKTGETTGKEMLSRSTSMWLMQYCRIMTLQRWNELLCEQLLISDRPPKLVM